MKNAISRIGLALSLVLALTATSEADSAYLLLKGQKSGVIKGGVITKGHEGQIQVFDVSHSIVSPRDPASGLPTGQRVHKPLVLTIPLDRATPLLYNVLCTNENISDLNLTNWTSDTKLGTGIEQMQYTIRLTNANIASIEQITKGDALGNNPKPYLRVSFTYQKIEWTWTDGGITAGDDWEARI